MKKIKKIKKIQKPSVPIQKTINIQELLASIDIRVNNKINNSIKTMIFPLKSLMDRRHKDYENLLANVVAIQTILERNKIVDSQEFMKEYKDILNNTIGIVNNDGKMSGYCGVEIYNMEDCDEGSLHP